ncbi:hypothetical protein F511_05767 [Dorcoceras hygrometricum]|uniref:Uncharacterized protein n=1 Tax=Dorcoceras hygrometricum TaxID=472368 RepID=A0A2Z7BJ02_9LAMI|nr:hypothetical protein F511_05767 [Dorcoceras hygrometricum]
MGNTDPNKTKAGNEYEVKPQYEELSKQLGGRHSNPVVTIPTIALDLSGVTHQSASPNVAPNQLIFQTKSSKRSVSTNSNDAASQRFRTSAPADQQQPSQRKYYQQQGIRHAYVIISIDSSCD